MRIIATFDFSVVYLTLFIRLFAEKPFEIVYGGKRVRAPIVKRSDFFAVIAVEFFDFFPVGQSFAVRRIAYYHAVRKSRRKIAHIGALKMYILIHAREFGVLSCQFKLLIVYIETADS